MIMSENDSVATSKPKINAYVSEETNKALEREMVKERRSKSQMVEILLEEALTCRGYEFSKDGSLEGDRHE
jgi:hypothetical protein